MKESPALEKEINELKKQLEEKSILMQKMIEEQNNRS